MIFLCFLFVLFGTLLIPYAGIQNDEALFTNPIYQNQFEFRIRFVGHSIPLMVMTYIGTVKTAFYWVWFKAFPPGLYSARLPMILLGAVTICFFSVLARKVSSPTGGWIATILLASDPIFLLTNTFDWGPVAIEHFLLVSACLLLVRFAGDAAPDSERFLRWGMFALGLALWNKAIFLASLAGLIVAAIVVCAGRVRAVISPKRAGTAILALSVGAAPLVLYNLRKPATTLKSNVNLEIPNWPVKVRQLRGTLNGSGLFGYLTSLDHEHPKRVVSTAARAGQWLRSGLWEWREGGLLVAIAGSLLLVPLWWRSAAARFSLLFCVVQWSLVIIMRDGGTSVHHVVLLWPFPHLFVAATLNELPWTKLALAVGIAAGAANLAVLSQYFLEFEKNGAGPVFTDAMIRFSERIPRYATASRIYVLDWGMQNTLALLHEGKLPLKLAESAFRSEPPSGPDRDLRNRILADRDAILLGHTEGFEVFDGVRAHLEAEARGAALRKDILETVEDSNGRPVFEIFRLAPQ